MATRRQTDYFKDIHFPNAGIDLSLGFYAQPVRRLEGGRYSRTTREGNNVRAHEPGTNRARGGVRAGLRRYIATPVVASWLIQGLGLVVTTEGPPVVQTSNSGRVVTVVAVSQGDVYYADAGATAWTLATNLTGDVPPLNFTGIVYSSALNQDLWFVDGINYCKYDALDHTVTRWAAAAGALPRDGDDNAASLITTWRGRLILSGLPKDPQNWFMSAVADPLDWDYSPQSTTPTQAVAGNNSPLGFIGDVVTTLIPYTDDVLVFGGDHTIYMMRGDPMAGGQIDLISDSIGMAWGKPWCKDPYGNIYFFSNRCGIYTLIPGQQPQRISQPVEQLLLDIDTGENAVNLIWDDRFQGLHVFVTELAAPAPATHFFFEKRTGAWWTDVLGHQNMNPVCCVTFDGNDPNDRVPLIGSWDGYVRSIDPDATTDDTFVIASSVVIGPLLTRDLDDLMLKDFQAVLGSNSGSVTYAVHVGATAEAALASTAVVTGTLAAGRNLTSHVRRADHAIYLKLTSSSYWAMESIRARLAEQGKVRRRGR